MTIIEMLSREQQQPYYGKKKNNFLNINRILRCQDNRAHLMKSS